MVFDLVSPCLLHEINLINTASDPKAYVTFIQFWLWPDLDKVAENEEEEER